MNQKQILRQQIASIIIDYYYQIAPPQEERNREIADRLEKLFLQIEEETVKAVIQEDEKESETVRNGTMLRRLDKEIRNKLRKEMRERYSQIRKARE